MSAAVSFRKRISLSRRDELRIELTRWRGVDLLNIRRWSMNGDGKFVPTKKGVAVSVRHVADVEQAVKQARRRAKLMGLLPPGGAR